VRQQDLLSGLLATPRIARPRGEPVLRCRGRTLPPTATQPSQYST